MIQDDRAGDNLRLVHGGLLRLRLGRHCAHAIGTEALAKAGSRGEGARDESRVAVEADDADTSCNSQAVAREWGLLIPTSTHALERR
jgi:hypothetical protein